MRPTFAEIDLSAIEHNVRVLVELAGDAELCAVVKADGYSHGAVPVARTAVRAGASWLGVALVEEGVELRESGIEAPILVLSEPRPLQMGLVVAHGLVPTVYTGEGLASAAAAANQAGVTLPVHLKVDTGMHRVGAAPADAEFLARAIASKPELDLEGVWSHCPVADEVDNPFTAGQVEALTAVVGALDRAGLRPRYRHLANSAATLAWPDSHFDMVRCGISIYGLAPAPALDGIADLRPAMSLRSEVSLVRRVPAGEAVSYGHRWRAESDTLVATVPIGYADGLRRRLGGEVLIGGRRRPVAGTVTMDQIMVDCGDDESVQPGDEVVLIGTQGEEYLGAAEVADRLGTIAYEIVCDIGSRVRRQYR